MLSIKTIISAKRNFIGGGEEIETRAFFHTFDLRRKKEQISFVQKFCKSEIVLASFYQSCQGRNFHQLIP